MKSKRSKKQAAGLLTSLFVALAAFAQEPQIVDVHMHFQMAPSRNPQGSSLMAIQNMAQFNISRSILMPPPSVDTNQRNFYDIGDVTFVQRDHPEKFALLGGSKLNVMIHKYPPEQVDGAVQSQFRKIAEETLAQGAVGFGEIAIHHLSLPAMGSQHAYEQVSPLHPLLQLLAKISAERNVPIDIHFDAVPEEMPLPDKLKANPKNPSVLPENMHEFMRYLGMNPQTKFVWSHVGFEPLLTRSPELVEALMKKFPNLYMSFRLNRSAPISASVLSKNGEIKPRWVSLIEAFPDRFMLGSDAFYDASGIARGSTEEGFENFRKLLSVLSEPARSAVAHGNAENIFKLK